MNRALARAIAPFGLVATGLLLAHSLPLPGAAPLAIAGASCALLAIASPKQMAWTLLALALIGLSGAWATHRWTPSSHDHLSRLLPDERTLIGVEGRLLETPARRPVQRGALGAFDRFSDDPLRARLRVDTLQGAAGPVSASAVLSLRLDGAPPALRAGDRVRATGWFTPVRAPMNPGAYDPRRRSAERSEAGSLNGALVEALPASPALRPALDRALDELRAGARRTLPDANDDRAALLLALVLGERGPAYDELATPFARSGLAHVLAISGMHLGVLAGLAVLVVRLTGHRPRLEALAVVLLVVFVLLLVPARAPIVRAGVVAIALALGALIGRRHHPLALLAWAGVVVLAWRPSELFAPGFQLSFGVVAALVTLAPRLNKRLFGPTPDPNSRTLRDHAWLWVRSAISASITAWLVALPLVAHHFGVVPLTAPLTAILAIPCAGLILAMGYTAVLAGLCIPGMGDALADALLASTEPLLMLVRSADAVPGGAIDVPSTSIAWTIAATLALSAWCAFGLGATRTARTGSIVVALALALWTARAWRPAPLEKDIALQIDALAMGDGACWFVRSGDQAMLYECGSRWTGAGVRAIPESARALGMPPTRRAIVTHPDLDHYACLPDSAERLGVREVLVPERFLDQAREQPDGPAHAFLELMSDRGVDVRSVGAGEAWSLGEASVEVLAPHPGAPYISDNDHALVLRLTVPTDAGERTVLLTGDIERRAIDDLSRTHPALRADVVEAPHHGSARPFARDFVASLEPTVVVQSTGPSRVDDPIWDGVRAGSAWHTTARDGAIRVRILRSGAILSGPILDRATPEGQDGASGTTSKRSTSTRPRSVTFRLGMTGSGMKLSGMKGS